MSLIMDVLTKQSPEVNKPRAKELNVPKSVENFFQSPAPSTTPPNPIPQKFININRALPGKAAFRGLLALAGIIFVGFLALNFLGYSSRSKASPSKPLSLAGRSPASFSSKTSARPSVSGSAARGANTVQGVLLDGKKPLCLINGTVFKIGDVWDGKKITAITSQGVSLADQEGNASFLATDQGT